MASVKKGIRPKFSEKRENVILVQDRISHTSKRILRTALKCRRITPYSTEIRRVPAEGFIINFGGGSIPIPKPLFDGSVTILNSPDKVAIAANKLETFHKLFEAKVPTVRWTTDRGDVEKWLEKDHRVLARLSVSSSGGRGINVISPGAPVPAAPLYTRYFPKTHEFRVHVVREKAIDIVEKKLRNDLRDKRQDVSTVRNHSNGWVFAHDGLAATHADDVNALKSLGVQAIRAVGLDFGAADILAVLDEANPRRLQKAVVCEVNSAPGIENTVTRDAYVKAFNEIIG